MKKNLLVHIALILFAVLAIPVQFAAQSNQGDMNRKHHHYKLIDMGTFGGLQSYINGFEYSGPLHNLNNLGLLAGWSDTSTLDPYQNSSNEFGNFCFNYGESPCYASHAFLSLGSFIFDLGTLPGGYSSATTWISSNGLVVGVSQNGEFDPQEPGSPTNYPELRAVLWRYGQIIDLGTLEGGPESGASSVNSRGQVVGWAINTVPDPNSLSFSGSEANFYQPIEQYQTRAFLWQNGAMTDLGTLGTGNDAWAQAINDNGQITGISYTNTTVNNVPTGCGYQGTLIPTEDPFFWENGTMTDMGGLGGTCGQPLFISNSGRVVGFSDLPEDVAYHPFVWKKNRGMRDLGTLGGHFGEAEMINDLGVVVGGTTLAGDSQLDAFLWDGKMHDLGALDGCSYAFAVNTLGQVVGNWGGANCSEGAFLWENGGPMLDLSTLLTAPSDLVLGAVSNNDLGEIAGIGVNADGYSHAILLVPCDENHPGVEGCDYGLIDASADYVAPENPAPATTQPSSNQNNAIRRMLRRRLGPPYRIPATDASTEPSAPESASSALVLESGATKTSDSMLNSLDSLDADRISRFAAAPSCTSEGRPCGEHGKCCSGLKCVFRGGSTRAGYVCEP